LAFSRAWTPAACGKIAVYRCSRTQPSHLPLRSIRITLYDLRVRTKAMKKLLMSTAIALSLATGAAIAADLTPQKVGTLNVELKNVTDAWRGSKIIGAAVTNENNDSIGKIDDLLIGRSDSVLYAVLSVGGFLGMGNKMVVVPYTSLKVSGDKFIVPGGSKDALKALPEFKYQTS
jgi:hypothetical protein